MQIHNGPLASITFLECQCYFKFRINVASRFAVVMLAMLISASFITIELYVIFSWFNFWQFNVVTVPKSRLN